MIASQRNLTDNEKRALKGALPWFGKKRKSGLREIEDGIAEVREFEFERAWDINACQPPCCPHTLLFKTDAHTLIYVESWDDIVRDPDDSEKCRLVLESLPHSRKLLKLRLVGPVVAKKSERVREFNHLFEISGPDCLRQYVVEELPTEVRSALDAA